MEIHSEFTAFPELMDMISVPVKLLNVGQLTKKCYVGQLIKKMLPAS